MVEIGDAKERGPKGLRRRPPGFTSPEETSTP